MTWRTLFFDLRSGLFIKRLVTWDPETGEFTCVEGPKGFATWEETNEAGRFLHPGGGRGIIAPSGASRNDARPLLTPPPIGLAADRREARQGGRRTRVL